MKSSFLNVILVFLVFTSCHCDGQSEMLDSDIMRVDILLDDDDWILISIKDRTEISCVFKYSNGIIPENKFHTLNTIVTRTFTAPLFDEINLADIASKGQVEGTQVDGKRIIVVLYDIHGAVLGGCHLSKGYSDTQTNKLTRLVEEITGKLQGFREIQPKEAICHKISIEKTFQKTTE